MASAFAAVRARPAELARPVWLVVNTEGMSSHAGSRRVLDELGVRAAWGIVAFGTDLRVSLGNRGRVDVQVRVAGRSSHSSQPWLGTNPIEGAADVIRALRSIPTVDPHPDLGPATTTPYGISCFPVAPHTIPERATIVVDRRLLPGGTAEDAVVEIREHLIKELPDTTVVVEPGVSMLPAAVDPHAPIVTSLLEGIERATRSGASTRSTPDTPARKASRPRCSGLGSAGSQAPDSRAWISSRWPNVRSQQPSSLTRSGVCAANESSGRAPDP
jgi:acetylornithine deacetylase/succinyl-diaminopimelate desuccinylase-like protein